MREGKNLSSRGSFLLAFFLFYLTAQEAAVKFLNVVRRETGKASRWQVVSDMLRTFVSERLQMTNVSWRSRSNRPTCELRRSRSVAKAEPPAFLPYTTFVKFANVHVLPSAPFCCGNICPQPAPVLIREIHIR